MRLNSFTITNFRSIKDAHKIKLSNLTAIIGKNNEGKSNILKALDIAVSIIRNRNGKNLDRLYQWNRDFPMELQSKRKGKTIFLLEFVLSSEEKKNFKKTIKSAINGYLPIQIEIDCTGKSEIRVYKKGIAGKSLTGKTDKIADFIASHIVFNYIPAIRTDFDAKRVVREMVLSEFRVLNENEDYLNALKTVAETRCPLLKNVSVEYEDLPHDIQLYHGDVDVIVDDGAPTNLELKGDGVKSLVTLGLLKNRFKSGIPSIIAIEEPESHLHPLAIHRLKEVVEELSSKSQVIISTHNPLFVNRMNLEANVLVEKGKAIAKPSIKRIRESLGVKASDNLISAEYAILVEGETDAIVLKKLIENICPALFALIKKGDVIIYSMSGIKNLKSSLHLFSTCACETYLIADNDNASRNEISQSIQSGLLSRSSYTVLACENQKESEIEDAFKYSQSIEIINEIYGLSLAEYALNGSKKWSDKVKTVLNKAGKILEDEWEVILKYRVANAIEKDVLLHYDEKKCPALKKALIEIEARCARKKSN